MEYHPILVIQSQAQNEDICLISWMRTVQEALFFKPHCYSSNFFNVGCPEGYNKINFFTNLDDHFIKNWFSPLCLLGN